MKHERLSLFFYGSAAQAVRPLQYRINKEVEGRQKCVGGGVGWGHHHHKWAGAGEPSQKIIGANFLALEQELVQVVLLSMWT